MLLMIFSKLLKDLTLDLNIPQNTFYKRQFNKLKIFKLRLLQDKQQLNRTSFKYSKF